MNQMFLNIADFNIQINFKEVSESFYKDGLKNKIKKHYIDFITPHKKRKIDFTIFIINKRIQPLEYIKSDKNNKIFTLINFFERATVNKIITYHYLSIEQFDKLLFTILNNLLLKDKGFIIYGLAWKTGNRANIITGKSKLVNLFLTDPPKIIYPILTDNQVIIRKKGRNFYLYHAPISKNKFWAKRNNKSYLIKNIYLLKESSDTYQERISNKEKLITQLLKLSNLPSLLQRLEYKQYSHKSLKYFLDFINICKFYYLGVSDIRKLVEDAEVLLNDKMR